MNCRKCASNRCLTVASWELDSIAVVAGQVIGSSVLDSGLLTYTPVSGETGRPYSSFEFDVSDGIFYSGNTHTMLINVLAPPSPSSRVSSTIIQTNPDVAQDVNDDGAVTAKDVLTLINYLSSAEPANEENAAEESAAAKFLDVSGDGVVTAKDVLQVVNRLMSEPAEGSSVNATAAARIDSVFSDTSGVTDATQLSDSEVDALELSPLDDHSLSELASAVDDIFTPEKANTIKDTLDRGVDLLSE